MKTSPLFVNARDFLSRRTRFGFVAALAAFVLVQLSASAAPAETSATGDPPPLNSAGQIPVALVISDGAVIIDFCGPWAVFRHATLPDNRSFLLYTVSDKTEPIRADAGMKIVPDYSFADAPAPKVIVIPAQNEPSKAMLDWIRKASKNSDVTMSVCTGAFILAKTGLLSGKSATTYHAAFKRFALDFPDIQLKRGARFVENGNLATAGGLSSGIDLALRVVERYFGREAAAKTAYNMEYQGQGWMNSDSNQVYATEPVPTAGHTLCPVCGMDVAPATAPKSSFNGKTYYFCSEDDKKTFEAAPEKFTTAEHNL